MTALTDESRWCDRAAKLIEIIGSNFEDHDKNFEPILALGLQIMMTGALEHLAEQRSKSLRRPKTLANIFAIIAGKDRDSAQLSARDPGDAR